MEVLTDIFGNKIRLTEERMKHILQKIEMKNQKSKIKETLLSPDIIVISKNENSVLLYHKYYDKTPFGEKYLLVAVKLLQDDAFIITSFFTDRVKRGEIKWQK